MRLLKRTFTVLVLALAAIIFLSIPEKKQTASELPTDLREHNRASRSGRQQNSKKTIRIWKLKSTASTISLSAFQFDLKGKYKHLSPKDIIQLLSSDLSVNDRNYLEHLLADSPIEEVDVLLDSLLEETFVDLSTKEEELHAIEDTFFLTAVTNRMNSVIRVMGLRGRAEAVGDIIDIALHYNVKESTVRVCYEAIGYLGTRRGKRFLLSELRKQKNPVVKSEIILALTAAGGAASVKQYLFYLKSRNSDLRNSAIVALGEIKEEKAVAAFEKMFFTTSKSSQELIVQALKKIGSDSSEDFLKKISQGYPHLVQGESSL